MSGMLFLNIVKNYHISSKKKKVHKTLMIIKGSKICSILFEFIAFGQTENRGCFIILI